MQGRGTIQSLVLDNTLAVPTKFGGTGLGAGPMDLLVASAASCYLMTMVGMLEAQKVDVTELILHTDTNPESKNLVIQHFLELKVSSDLKDNQIKMALLH
ncbi:OsmC family protein, partial [Acinetobacter johnsonii]|uniref:OsmC family protein n=1 Tax=Acinetobacter johnsonii TaxID=40214 RepID=UPI002449A278